MDWDGKQLPPVAVGTFDLPAGGVKQADFPIDTNRRGTFRLGFELTVRRPDLAAGGRVQVRRDRAL